MTTIKVTTTLEKLLRNSYDFIEICDDVKRLNNGQVELVGSVKMTKFEVLSKYSPDTVVSRWINVSYRGESGIAIVIEGDSCEV